MFSQTPAECSGKCQMKPQLPASPSQPLYSLSSISVSQTQAEKLPESVLAYQNIELAADALSQDMIKEKPEENKGTP